MHAATHAADQPPRMSHAGVARYASHNGPRSRSVSDRVLAGRLDIPALPPRLRADCEREVAAHLGLEAGDVEALNLARARARWPDHAKCARAVADWARECGLAHGLIASAELAFMACRGARCHHDADQYGDSVFCNLFMSEDKGLDVHFPAVGRRIPLRRGTVLLFDTGQPHAVVRRGSDGFDEADFAPGRDCTQLFLTWELPAEDETVARLLGIAFDVAALQP